MLTSVEENYLKAIYKLSDKDGKVNTVDLGKHLNVSSPTVNSMARKLASKELVEYNKYKPITITEKGRKLSLSVLRRHRLTEMFLTEKMGFDWDKVHEIAEQIEHIKSAAFFDRMEELLNHPRFDPHGSPIPDKEGKLPELNLQTLCSCKPKTSCLLTALADTSKESLNFLSSRNMFIGSHITVLSIEPFDGSMMIRLNNKDELTLSKKVCNVLLVEAEKKPGKSNKG
jgi:DtxR family transcriptional regulator, Mn-dependent transcriptional regulator